MPSSLAHNHKGFTQIEVAITVVIIGILGALSGPSFLSWVNERKLNVGLAELQGTLIEGQQQAVRLSKDCTINLPTGSNPVLSSNPSACLRNGSRTLDNLNLRHSFSTSALAFDFKGRVPNSMTSEQTVVLSLANESNGPSKCIVIAPGIGLIRVGDYNGPSKSTFANNCKTKQS